MNKKRKFRSSTEWKRLRKEIINRDRHCLICGNCNNLEAHHIVPLDVMWNMRTEKSNIITLCQLHHNQVHNGMFSQYYLAELLAERNEMIGKKFGRLTVIEETGERDKHKYKIYKCQCSCGNIIYTNCNSLKSGNTKSCGCLKNEKLTKHGKYYTRLYRIYNNMKNRCCNKKHRDFQYYGGRGVTVCDEWLDDFTTFYDWAMKNGYKDNLTLDRIDVNGDYEPSNCRWTTPKEQANNTRNNVCLTYNGETKTLHQWADTLGLKYACLYSRYRRKWKIKDILFGKSN